MDNILKKIINKKKENIISYKNKYSENFLLNNINSSINFIDFKEKMIDRYSKKKISIISFL